MEMSFRSQSPAVLPTLQLPSYLTPDLPHMPGTPNSESSPDPVCCLSHLLLMLHQLLLLKAE